MRLRNRFFSAVAAASVAAASIAAASLFAQTARAGTTGAIDGVVSDINGHPIGDVQVAAAAPSYATKTVTGANGFYALNGLPLDTYVVSFSKTGFQSNFIPGVTISQDQTRAWTSSFRSIPRSWAQSPCAARRRSCSQP